jgi:hypothetical protein
LGFILLKDLENFLYEGCRLAHKFFSVNSNFHVYILKLQAISFELPSCVGLGVN